MYSSMSLIAKPTSKTFSLHIFDIGAKWSADSVDPSLSL